MKHIIKYILLDIIKSKIIIAYTILIGIISTGLFLIDTNVAKSTISLINVILLLIPLFSIIFSTVHYYNSYEFIELLVSQPISRTKIILSEYLGIIISLCFSLFIGLGIPVLIFNCTTSGATILLCGFLLTTIFTSLALLFSVISRDKARGIGAAIFLWLFCTVIYDGIILMILFSFADYPIEQTILVLTHFNPVDIARIYLLIQLDASAMMGYTGALFLKYFGSTQGMFFTLITMLTWAILPVWICLKVFKKKDL